MRDLSLPGRLLGAVDHGLRTLCGLHAGTGRPIPRAAAPGGELNSAERHHAAGLMRVNHAGEIAAQALYQGQALFAQSEAEREFLLHAGQEEADHLRWTRSRVESLGGRPSLLDPLWYAGAFALGALASRMGGPVSMGFLEETEVQVEAHLKGHLRSLPERDTESRAVVERMMADERSHAQAAQRRGATPLPRPIGLLMRAGAGVMTRSAYWV